MRRIAMCATAVLAVSVLTMGSAGATAVPIAGTVSCSMSGGLTLKPALKNDASTKLIKIKGSATASNCTGTTTGGKGPIAGAKIKISGALLPGASCLTLAVPAFGPTKVQVKWLWLNPASKLATNAVDNTTVAGASMDLGSATLTVTLTPPTKNAFVNQPIILNMGLDDSLATLATVCTTGISSLAFGINPSTVTSGP